MRCFVRRMAQQGESRTANYNFSEVVSRGRRRVALHHIFSPEHGVTMMNSKANLTTLGMVLGTLAAAAAHAMPPDVLPEGMAAPATVLAQRQEGRPDMREEKETKRKSMEEEARERQRRMEDEADGATERMREERQEQERAREITPGEEPKGLEQQRERKMEQEQKELGKGSEQGQEAREQRKKWWRFWE